MIVSMTLCLDEAIAPGYRNLLQWIQTKSNVFFFLLDNITYFIPLERVPSTRSSTCTVPCSCYEHKSLLKMQEDKVT